MSDAIIQLILSIFNNDFVMLGLLVIGYFGYKHILKPMFEERARLQKLITEKLDKIPEECVLSEVKEVIIEKIEETEFKMSQKIDSILTESDIKRLEDLMESLYGRILNITESLQEENSRIHESQLSITKDIIEKISHYNKGLLEMAEKMDAYIENEVYSRDITYQYVRSNMKIINDNLLTMHSNVGMIVADLNKNGMIGTIGLEKLEELKESFSRVDETFPMMFQMVRDLVVNKQNSSSRMKKLMGE